MVILLESPIALAKAQKNATELAGLRAAYLRDGAAWARWAAWLEERVAKKRIETDEWTAAVEFRKVREQVPLWAGMESYDAISASGENAGAWFSNLVVDREKQLALLFFHSPSSSSSLRDARKEQPDYRSKDAIFERFRGAILRWNCELQHWARRAIFSHFALYLT